MKDFIEDLQGMRWDIIREVALNNSSPKSVASKLGITLASASQQLRYLEALGYLKRQRVDKGKGGRSGRQDSSRVMYSVSRRMLSLASIQQGSAIRGEIKPTTYNQFLVNVMVSESRQEAPFIIKFYHEREDLINHAEGMFLIRTGESPSAPKGSEADKAQSSDKAHQSDIHFLVITDNLTLFRQQTSSVEVTFGGETRRIRFWSHTFNEVKQGVLRKEQYFLNQVQNSVPLIEKKAGILVDLIGGKI